MDICIVTGSSGLIGSESARFFSAKKFKVIGIDNNLRAIFFGKNGDTTWVKKQLKNKLKDTNSKLWQIEDDIRVCEKNQDFSSSFINLARSVYITNDERFELKNSINENESRKKPSRPKSIANPPKMKATGYPENNRSAKVTNITMEMYSCPTHTSASPREISSSIINDPDIV